MKSVTLNGANVLRTYKLIFPFTIILIFGIFMPVLAGWTEDTRITDRGHEIYPQIIARNDTLHVAWHQIAGDDLTSYIRSLDGGSTWGELVDLSEQGHIAARSDLSLNNSLVMVAWADQIPLESSHIAYSISSGGENWPLPRYLLPDDYHGNQMAFCGSGDSLYIVYHADSNDSTGYWPIRFLYSPDLGQTWSDEQTIGYTPAIYINNIIMKKCAGKIFIVWSSVPVPELTTFEVITVFSHDGGESWSEKIILSEDGGHPAQGPCLSCNQFTDEIAVGWMDYNYPGDLFIRLSSDGGYTWESEIHVTDHHSISSPNIEFVGDTLWAVWEDFSFANQRELGFRKSIDRGLSWGPIERLTNAEGNSHYPWLSYDNCKVHLVWEEYHRPPYFGDDVYYKRWEPDVGVDEIHKPDNVFLLSSYPNPFNSSTVINYSNIKGGEIEIYDICGRLLRTLNAGGGQEAQYGQGKITWDATDASGEKVSSGVYFARAATPQGFKSIKLLYVR